MRKSMDNRVKKQVALMTVGAATEIVLTFTSFVRHLITYPGQTGIWFAYLTDWKMMLSSLDGLVKFYKIIKALNISSFEEELLTDEKNLTMTTGTSTNTTQLNTDEKALADKRLEILREPILEIPSLNIVMAVDFLYWGLDRSGDWLSVILHLLDLLILSMVYLAADTPVLSSSKLKNRFVRDHIIPFAILLIYAIFYYVYQGVFGLSNEEGNPPYAVLDWNKSPDSTALYSSILPFAMTILNGTLIKLLEMTQKKLHSDHEVKDYSSRQRNNCCTKITSFLSNLIPSSIWSRRGGSSPPNPMSSLNFVSKM